MADGGTVEINFKARLDQLERDMSGVRSKIGRHGSDAGDEFSDRFRSKLHSLGSSMGSIGATIGKGLVVGIAGAAVGLGALFKSSIDAAEESRKVGAQTAAVIASTGGVANVSAKHVASLSDELAAATGIDDELIASGSNLLLTFTNVRNEVGKGNDVFDQATAAALDMSVALGTDMKSASMLVGKALNDPIKGMTALTRSGVQFTAQQKDQVEAMVEAGNTLGAQKVILKELATQFEGSAAAAGSPMARLKVVVGNLQEELGARLLPVVGKVANVLADKLPGAMDRVGSAVSGLWSLFAKRDFTGAMTKAFGVEEDSAIVATLFRIRDAVVSTVSSAVGWVRANWPQIKETVLEVLGAVVGWVQANWPKIKSIISETMETVRSVISGVVDVVMTIWRNFGSQIMDVVAGAWAFIQGAIHAAMQVIQGIIKTVTSIIHGDWSGAWEGIKQILAGAWTAIQAIIDAGLTLAKNAISVAWEIVKGIFSGAWDALKGIVREGIAWIVDKFLGFVETFLGLAEKAFGWVKGVGPKLREAKDAVERFRDDTNAALRGIQDKTITVRVNHVENYARTYGPGYTGGDNATGVYAAGGLFTSPTFGLFGEAGPELLLPLTDMDRTRELLAQAGLLGESDMAYMSHSGDDGGGSHSMSAGGGRSIQVGPFYGVRQDDLPTEIPRRLRGALHMWDR